MPPSAQLAAVNTDIGRARYAAIAERLRAAITAGRWAAGEPIPAETVLMQEFAVALGTMRQAIALLVNEGLLERRHGRGTFVRAGLAGASLMRFFRFGASGAAQIPKSKIMSGRTSPRPPSSPINLASARAAMPHMARTRWLDDAPRLLLKISADARRFSAMVASEPAAMGDLMYPEYAARCGVVVHRATGHDRIWQLQRRRRATAVIVGAAPVRDGFRQAFDIAGGWCGGKRQRRRQRFPLHRQPDLVLSCSRSP
ncbi:MAG: GntR family transcriptional regulator [Betaproteobacteria bacterium]|nr:GntR family transcriptional regulator [Betaproteobacteria bacterium]